MAWQGLCSIAAGFASAFGWKQKYDVFTVVRAIKDVLIFEDQQKSHQKRDNYTIINCCCWFLLLFSLQVPSLSRNKDGLGHSVHGRSVGVDPTQIPRLLFWKKMGWGVRSPELFGHCTAAHDEVLLLLRGSAFMWETGSKSSCMQEPGIHLELEV